MMVDMLSNNCQARFKVSVDTVCRSENGVIFEANKHVQLYQDPQGVHH